MIRYYGPPSSSLTQRSPSLDSCETIGMHGGSGHTRCDFWKFNGANFGAFMSAYFVGNLGIVLTSIFRVNAGTVLAFTVVLQLVSTLMGPCLGCMHDGEYLQPIFERTGCKRTKCGRRAPHLFYAIPASFLCTFLSYRMPSMATMTTTPSSTAKLTNQDVSWVDATYQTWDAKDKVWNSELSFAGPEQYTDQTKGRRSQVFCCCCWCECVV